MKSISSIIIWAVGQGKIRMKIFWWIIDDKKDIIIFHYFDFIWEMPVSIFIIILQEYPNLCKVEDNCNRGMFSNDLW